MGRKEYLQKYRDDNKEKVQAASREWNLKNPDRMRNTKLMTRYGITLAQFDAMMENQNGQCAICGTTDPKRKGSRYLSVDHCHTTGVVRGLLCYKCNVALGNFEDDTDRLRRAIEYLGGSID